MKATFWIIGMGLLGALGWYLFPGSAQPLAPRSIEAPAESAVERRETIAPPSSPAAPNRSSFTQPAPTARSSGGATETKLESSSLTADRGILRDASGRPARLSQAESLKRCEALGMRLPTIRELVRWKGMLMEAYETQAAPAGLTKEEIDAVNPDGTKDRFFNVYNANAPYKNRKGDEGNNWFWSSSSDPKSGEKYSYNDDSSYVSQGVSPDDENPNRYSATRCYAAKR